MEVFTVLFTWVDERVKEDDFYFKGLELKRAPAFNFNSREYEFYKRAIPVVCSDEIAVGDEILVVNMKNLPKTLGKVLSIDKQKNTAEIEVLDKMKFNDKVIWTGNFSQITEEPLENCFYPIIELNVDNKSSSIEDCDEISREKLEFKTICPKCSNEFRQPKNCDTHGIGCENKNKKQLAFIK